MNRGKVTIAIIGCGQRGKIYASYALIHPELCTIVACAEPRRHTRQLFVEQFSIPEGRAFETWEALLEANALHVAETGHRIAEAAVIAVQDRLHYNAVLAFAGQGFNLLCEKPIATNIGDCIRMADAVGTAGVVFGCGHVMRYSPYVQEISEIIFSKQLGELINVVHIEPVGYFHFAHSYVRGNWGNEKNSCFSLMTKSCHDIDLLCHWFKGHTPVRVSSFGSLSHFRKSNKPSKAGDATRCIECPAEAGCAYSAKKIYIDPVQRGETGWPVDTIMEGIPDIESVTEALGTSTYGLCVYESSNDVADHQVVNIEFSSGATASFTMVAFTSLVCQRQTRLHFSNGEIVGDGIGYTVTNFSKRESTRRTPATGGGHGGGDVGLCEAFVKAVAEKKQMVLGTDMQEILKSHLTVFAVEHSRRNGTVVHCEDFEKEMRECVVVKKDTIL